MRLSLRPFLLSLIAAAISVPAQAAITYSGAGQNVTIPIDFDGVFINFTDPLDEAGRARLSPGSRAPPGKT